MHLMPARPVYAIMWTTAVFTIPERTSADLLEYLRIPARGPARGSISSEASTRAHFDIR